MLISFSHENEKSFASWTVNIHTTLFCVMQHVKHYKELFFIFLVIFDKRDLDVQWTNTWRRKVKWRSGQNAHFPWRESESKKCENAFRHSEVFKNAVCLKENAKIKDLVDVSCEVKKCVMEGEYNNILWVLIMTVGLFFYTSPRVCVSVCECVCEIDQITKCNKTKAAAQSICVVY